MAESDRGVQHPQESGDRGVPSLVIRKDSAADTAGTDGYYGLLQVDANGSLRVTGGGGGTEYTEDVAAPNPIVGTATMMERDDALGGLTPAEGDWAGLRCDANGALWINVNTSALPAGASTSAKQLADGHNVTIDNISTNEVFVRGGGTAGSAVDGEVVAVQGIASGTAMAVTESTPLSGFATETKQLAAGHTVTEIAPALIGPAAIVVDSIQQVAINLTTAADQVLVASAASKQIWVYGYTVVCGSAAGTTVSFQDEDNLAISGVMVFAENGGASVSPSGNFAMPIWKLGTDKDLEIDITGGDVDGHLTYAIVSV